MKLTVKQQKKLIGDAEVRACFMARTDIKPLEKKERERKWSEHLVHLDAFRKLLSGLDSFVVPVGSGRKRPNLNSATAGAPPASVRAH